MQSGEGMERAARRPRGGCSEGPCARVPARRGIAKRNTGLPAGTRTARLQAVVVRDCALCALRPGCRPIGLVGRR